MSIPSTADREIVVTRLFDAPRELVFNVFNDATQKSNWWGPNGFRTTTHSMDFRVGGAWDFTMHGPDGTDYPNYVVYTEILPPDVVRYDHGMHKDDKHPHFRASVRFDEEDGGTRVTLHLVFDTPEQCENVKKFGAVEGGNQTLERLEKFLIQQQQ